MAAGRLLPDGEFAVLKRFLDAGRVEDSQHEIVRRLAQKGLFKVGFHEEDDHRLTETAKLTAIGRRILHRAEIANSRIGRAFYRLHSALS